jgi:hypothetical protein
MCAQSIGFDTPFSFDCDGSDTQKWLINRGDGKIRVGSNPNLCLDAGTGKH